MIHSQNDNLNFNILIILFYFIYLFLFIYFIIIIFFFDDSHNIICYTKKARPYQCKAIELGFIRKSVLIPRA